MIRLFINIVRVIPWVLLSAILIWFLIDEKFFSKDVPSTEYYQNTIVEKVESMGKMELVKYHFQEITEVKKVAESIDFKLFKYKPLPDSKAVLISKGSAVGCIDLTKIDKNKIQLKNDTIYILLPEAELCYFKVDLANSRIYDLKIDYMRQEDKTQFMDQLYKQAELNIKQSALESGILEETYANAETIMKPLLETLTGKPVVLRYNLSGTKLINRD